MNNNPIGFFDSGLGGLTCIPPLLKKMPEQKIIYYGDTARTPYGSKDPKTIITFAKEIISFLIRKRAKLIVIACNTVSAVALSELRKEFSEFPIIGIISPAVNEIINNCDEKNNIGIIGTRATVNTSAYKKKIHKKNPFLNIFEHSCPAFVPLIEEGIVKNEIMDLTIKYYLDGFIERNKIDTLVLGCTHYPFIKKSIEKFYKGIKMINPSEEVLVSILDELKDKDLFAEKKSSAALSKIGHEFYASDLSENFTNMLDVIFREENFTVSFLSP
ncbi:MAG: glutamate racemase [Clostridiales Family XIII bacterium]|jgi:glutamate racemase|nr:glutamate racemase [Clostridiales Family XIII bacterium]